MTPIPTQIPLADPMSPDQSSEMPTRALWVGSIPAPTSSATLLQIFSPFGPVESARVLGHKVCPNHRGGADGSVADLSILRD
jgi:protein JSN1